MNCRRQYSCFKVVLAYYFISYTICKQQFLDLIIYGQELLLFYFESEFHELIFQLLTKMLELMDWNKL